jgi:positive regulator of sigma E activity
LNQQNDDPKNNNLAIILGTVLPCLAILTLIAAFLVIKNYKRSQIQKSTNIPSQVNTFSNALFDENDYDEI